MLECVEMIHCTSFPRSSNCSTTARLCWNVRKWFTVQVSPVLLIVLRLQGYAGMCGNDSLYKFPRSLIVPRQQGYAGMCGNDSLYKFPRSLILPRQQGYAGMCGNDSLY